MKGIVIAAGLGSRMGGLTEHRPKCLLPMRGRPLLDWTIDGLRNAGCNEITIVTGYLSEQLSVYADRGIKLIHNPDFRSNNVLHSLMHAREDLEGSVLATYADIWVEPDAIRRVAETPGGMVLGVDREWRDIYIDRPGIKVEDSELALFDGSGRLTRIGKSVEPIQQVVRSGYEARTGAGTRPGDGEFLGLWCMREPHTTLFRKVFNELDAKLDANDSFQFAAAWRLAYVTDLFQELLDRGHILRCALLDRGWAEFDTASDYWRLPKIARTRRLDFLLRSSRPWGLAGRTPAATPSAPLAPS